MDWEYLGWVVLAVLAIYELNAIARHLGRIERALRERDEAASH